MFESMYAPKGVGLAAPQIGMSKRITVIDCSNGENDAEKLVLINPEILQRRARRKAKKGACASRASASR